MKKIEPTGKSIAGQILKEKLKIAEEHHYRNFFELSITGNYLSTPEGRLLDCNQAFVSMLGYSSRDEILATDMAMLYPMSSDRNLFLEKLRTDKMLSNAEINLMRKDGRMIQCIENVIGIFNEQGDLLEFMGYMIDITQNKEIEKQVSILAQTIRSIKESVSITSINDTIIFVNDAFKKTYGYEDSELIGKHISMLRPPDNDAVLIDTINLETIKGGWQGELMNLKKDGTFFPVALSTSTVRDASGKVIALVGVATDITQRKLAEQAMIDSEQRFSIAFKSSPYAIIITRMADGKVIETNESLHRIAGYSAKEVVGDSSLSLNLWVNPADRNQVISDLINKIPVNGREYLFRKKNGEILTGLFSAELIVINNEQCILSSVNDITDRKIAEETLREREQLWRTIIKTSPDGIAIATLDGIVTEISDRACKMYGYNKPEEILGRPILEFLDEKYREKARGRIHELLSGTYSGVAEYQAIKMDGSRFFVEINSAILRDKEGKPTHLFFIERDVTARKIAEEQLLKSEERFRLLVKNSSDIIVVINLDGIQTFVSQAVEKITGYTPEEVSNRHLSEIVHPDDLPEINRVWNEALLSPDKIHKVQYRHIHKTRGWVHVEANGQSFVNDPQVQAVVVSVRNMTERMEAETALKESEMRLQTLINSTPDIICFKDGAGRWLIANNADLELFQLKNVDYFGKTDQQLAEFTNPIYKDAFQNCMETDEKAWLAKTISIAEENIPKTDGTHVIYEVIKVPVFNDEGSRKAMVVLGRDITERKRTENALHQKVIALSQPLDDPTGIQFNGLFNLEDIQRIQDEFAEATNVASIITHPDGTPITKPSNFCRLCNDIIRKTEKGLANCYKSDALIGRHNPDGPILQPCLSGGLWDAGASITVGGKHIANWLIGQVRNNELDEEKFLAYADEIGADREEFRSALNEVGQMSKEQLQAITRSLFSLANELSLKAYQNVQQARFITDRKQTELIHKIQYNIADAMVTAKNLNELFEKVREELKVLVDTSNIFIAFYDDKTDMLSSPFIKNEKGDSINRWPAANSLTGLVVHEKKSLLLSKSDIGKLAEEGVISLRGSRSEKWLGVPLEISEKVIGAIVVQSFDNPDAYDQTSREILEIIANQLSVYIEHKKSDEHARKLSAAIVQSPESIVITDYEGTIEYVNPKFTELTGYTAEEAIGQNPRILKSGEQSVSFYGELWDTIKSGKRWTGELRNKKKTGELYWESANISPIVNETGNITHFVAVKEDITEKKKMLEELVAAKDKAEAANRLKTAFMNNISHEVRTPLNCILGFGEAVIEPDITEAEKMEHLKILNANSDRLINTITGYMDIALIASGNMEMHPDMVSPDELLDALYMAYRQVCKDKRLDLKLSLPEKSSEYSLNTDPELLKKILTHLLDNAVKFTHQGHVHFGYTINGQGIEFFVTDTGSGISKDFQKRIFERFAQEDSSLTRKFEGSGIGLAIVKGLCDLLGAKIHLVSQKDYGTSFYIGFSTSGPNEKEVAPAIQPKQTSHPIILIAEDEIDNFAYLQIVLQKTGATILHARNGKEAVEMCQAHPEISIVFMDLKMPVMNGLEATQIIKSHRKDLPVVAVTAYAMSGDERRALSGGCDDYVSKPVKKDMILSKLKKYGLYDK